jgi:hypothetical protein
MPKATEQQGALIGEDRIRVNQTDQVSLTFQPHITCVERFSKVEAFRTDF